MLDFQIQVKEAIQELQREMVAATQAIAAAVTYIDGLSSARELYGSDDSVDPPSLGAGALDSNVRTLTVVGAEVGDFVVLSFTTAGIVPVLGEVSATDTVRYRLQNVTGSTLDGAQGTVFAVVTRRRAT